MIVHDYLTTASLQPLFARTALLITDYSSVDFDIAYLEKPVVYYHFDAAQFFTGTHHISGYFDYRRDGFGPVCEAEADVVSSVETILSGDEPAEYLRRRRATFPYRDGRCCERVYECIMELDAPERELIPSRTCAQSPKQALRNLGIDTDVWVTQFYQGATEGSGPHEELYAGKASESNGPSPRRFDQGR